MEKIRLSKARGFADHGWLKSYHTFSFASYYDPSHMGFKTLRVINEDRIEKGTGFASHPHRDMEIISYVIKGALEHQDSMGNKTIITPGEVQMMSAGSGVVHSEHNADKNNQTHFFQIWIVPESVGGTPSYGQKSFESELNSKELVLVISKDGREGSIKIKQDADLYISRLRKNQQTEFSLRKNRGAWIQIIKGKLSINDSELQAGDAFSTEEEQLLRLEAREDSEFLLFDL